MCFKQESKQGKKATRIEYGQYKQSRNSPATNGTTNQQCKTCVCDTHNIDFVQTDALHDFNISK